MDVFSCNSYMIFGGTLFEFLCSSSIDLLRFVPALLGLAADLPGTLKPFQILEIFLEEFFGLEISRCGLLVEAFTLGQMDKDEL
jgi:hypothetical protein